MAETLTNLPPPIRGMYLETADPGIRRDLEQQVDQITREQEKQNPPPTD